MKIIHSLFYFAGSIYLALILIALLAVYVMAGTFLESVTESHLHAAAYTYHHPAFNMLLGFFFVNILISAVRRWPFKNRHIPFLITHLGLLMILSGVMIKNRYGLQGNMLIKEGSGTQLVTLPHSHAIAMVDQAGKRYQYPKEKPPHVDMAILAHHPNVKEEWLSWIKGRFAYIMGMAPIEVVQWSSIDPWPVVKAIHSSGWHILALNTENTEEALRYAWLDATHHPLLLIIQNPDFSSSCWAFNSDGKIYQHHFQKEKLNSLLIYDEGFSGYGVQLYLPSMENKKAIESPPIKLFQAACQKAVVNFPHTFLHFLQFQEIPPAVLKALDWSSISVQDQQAIYWTALLLNKLDEAQKNGEDLKHYLKNNHWPLAIPETDDYTDFTQQISQQMFSVIASLPETDLSFPKKDEDQIAWLSAYLKGYGIVYKKLLPDFIDFPSDGMTSIETTLQPHFSPLNISNKWEDNRSGITLQVRKENIKESILLTYEETESHLRWPVLNGEYLLSFQLEGVSIPYRVRLKQARQINYPHSEQPYSYESDVAIGDQEITLSMNRVHQTWDGYRFYLAGIATGKEESIKQVQIVVNHDPAKYLLTYPGGALVALGIILLFWVQPYRKKT